MLRVWLPLTKDLRNQGLDDVTVTNNGATFNSAGKLGGCYSVDNVKQIGCNNCLNLGTTFSIAFWSKINSKNVDWGNIFKIYKDGADYIGMCSAYTTDTNPKLGFHIYRNNGSNAREAVVDGYKEYSLNNWFHTVITVTPTKAIVYKDGVVFNTFTINKTFPSITNYSLWLGKSGIGNGLDCSINDFRIYDHCLSPMEVKELAKGLVLHYPLNRQGWGQENLILESHKVTGGGNASGITRTYESDGSMKIVSTSGNGNWCSLSFAKDSNTNVGNNMAVGNTYCISCDVKIETGTVLPTLFINSGNGYKQLKPVNGSIITGQWIRVYYNSTWADPGTGYGNISLHLGFSGVVGTYYFKNFKLEKSSIPTPWCPNVADSNNMGLNGTTEYDCSGFCNNGTRTGTFTWTSDTPKYNVSTVFPSGSNFIIAGRGAMVTDSVTVSLWCKYSTWGNPISCTEGGGWNFENGSNSIRFPVYVSGVGYKLAESNIAPSTLINQWHMITGTFDKTNVKIYIDGELKGTTATGSTNGIAYPSSNVIFIGAESAGSATSPESSYFVGNISDVRIYATALSADDVKSLYQNSAYIDSSGNIYGAVHSEV